jgi:5'-nucleotidase (lipoprotein e(P4) family)
VELERRGEPFTSATWAVWVERREAQAFPGAIEFLEEVHALGGKIAVVTNRREPLCPATRDNLRQEGVPFDVVLCRPVEGSGEKEPRWERVTSGSAADHLPPLPILLWVGDNIQDFPELTQELRNRDSEAFADFGRRFIVIPNPLYGSWEDN